MNNDELEMKFDPNTIEHLGVRMYSTLPPVLAELIANSYDADAENVQLFLNDQIDTKKEIAINDDGIGMTFEEINQKFLLIGRNRRDEDKDLTSPKGRKAIGKKGLGKLSFFGIAHEIEIETKKSGKLNVFKMIWEDIKSTEKGKDYKPTILKKDEACNQNEHGTKITLRNIQRESDFNPENIATSLSKIFIIDSGFKITISHNNSEPIEINNDRKYVDLDKEIEWTVPTDIGLQSEYENKEKITGHLIATEKPISPKTNMRGIVLFSRKKLVNQAEYFSDSTSSHFFSYLTGWLEVNFIDDLPEDVISTNRQSLNWDHPKMKELREYLQSLIRWLEKDWRAKRAEKREKKISDVTGVNITEWYSKLPDDIKSKIKPVVDSIVQDAELSETVTETAVQSLHAIIPEYPKYHWRHLHQEIKTIARDDYENARYFDATEKATRLYIQRVKDRSSVDTGKDDNDMDSAFNTGNGKLMVTDCSDPTRLNIQSGHQMLSKGVVFGFRNPLAHNPEYQKKLVDTGLFSEKDCLDILSLISHLFTRLENAQDRPESITN